MTHYEKQSMKELRAGMGEGLVEAGKRNENVVALSADVKGSVKMDGFAKGSPSASSSAASPRPIWSASPMALSLPSR